MAGSGAGAGGGWDGEAGSNYFCDLLKRKKLYLFC